MVPPVQKFAVGNVTLCPLLVYATERHLVYYACHDIANVYPVSPVNVIHSTIACEAIELS